MLRPDLSRWSLTERALITELYLLAPHPRTRERLLSLRDIARGTCASDLCKPPGAVTTMLNWVHDLNDCGPQALIYQPSDESPSPSEPLESLINEALRGPSRPQSSQKNACRRCVSFGSAAFAPGPAGRLGLQLLAV